MATVLLLVAVLLFSLQFRPVQTYIAKKAADYLSKELNTTISLSGIYLQPFKSVVIEDLLVLDQERDTLLNTPKFLVDLNLLSLKFRRVDINTVQINQGSFYLKTLKDKSTNLDFIIDYFDSGPSKKPKKKPYEISFDRIILNALSFKYKNFNRDTIIKGVNFDDIHLSNLNGIFEDLNTRDHIVQVNIKNLNFREKSGFYLKNLNALATVDSNAIEMKNLLLVTDRSRISNYYQMKFQKYKDFNDYVNKVRMKADFRNSHISSRDISYFTPALDHLKFDIDVDGQVSGLVNNLRSKKLTVKAGKGNLFQGGFCIKRASKDQGNIHGSEGRNGGYQ